MTTMKDITYCTNSTIIEAWAVIIGFPGKVDSQESEAIVYNARKVFGDFETQPSVVFVERSGIEAVPAFWRQQLAWQNGTYLARVGHRYLSVHFIKRHEQKYETYDMSLKPQIEHWLSAFQNTLAGVPNAYPIERVGFGYVNEFFFPEANFDLSRYLKLNVGVGGECAKDGIVALEINTELVHQATKAHVYVNVLVRPDGPDSGRVIVRTKVEAQKRIDQDHLFTDKGALLNQIATVKAVAKNVFFDLATEETHKIMGAQNATDAT